MNYKTNYTQLTDNFDILDKLKVYKRHYPGARWSELAEEFILNIKGNAIYTSENEKILDLNRIRINTLFNPKISAIQFYSKYKQTPFLTFYTDLNIIELIKREVSLKKLDI